MFRFMNMTQNPVLGGGEPGRHIFSFNVNSPLGPSMNDLGDGDPTAPPPNPHASSPFIVKMQCGGIARGFAAPRREYIGFYDEERTFNICIVPASVDSDTYERLDTILLRRGSLNGVKLFVWARRVGEWELAIALDPLPNQNIPW